MYPFVYWCIHISSYLNAIQTSCPHILRYITAAVVITNRRRPTILKDLVRVIKHVRNGCIEE